MPSLHHTEEIPYINITHKYTINVQQKKQNINKKEFISEF